AAGRPPRRPLTRGCSRAGATPTPPRRSVASAKSTPAWAKVTSPAPVGRIDESGPNLLDGAALSGRVSARARGADRGEVPARQEGHHAPLQRGGAGHHEAGGQQQRDAARRERLGAEVVRRVAGDRERPLAKGVG